ncbi:hypothetical protein ABTW95_19200 [Spirillospora sp. NPDC127506]
MTGTGVGTVDAALVEGRLREHHRRCLPALTRLRILAKDGWEADVDVRAATAEVMVELGAAGSVLLDALPGSVRRDALAHFLGCRANRLKIVAEHAVATADAGNLPMLRRLLYQFHALAEAMWKVQLGLQARKSRPVIDVGSAFRVPARRRPHAAAYSGPRLGSGRVSPG